MSLSLQKLNDSETGSRDFVALWKANLFFSSIQTLTCKKKMIKFLIFNQSINYDREWDYELTRGNLNGLAVHRLNHSVYLV